MIHIKVNGLKEFQNGLNKLPEAIRGAVGISIRISAELVVRESKPVTPFDTGRLRGSIRPEYIRMTEALISPHTDYAIYVHEGTRFMKGRPFMVWGVKKAKPEIEKVFGEEIEKAVNNSF